MNMLHLNGDSGTERDMLSVIDHGSLDAGYLHEMYMDSRSPYLRSRSPSPMSSDSSISHTFSSGLASSTPIPTTNLSSINMSQIGLQPSNYVHMVSNSKELGTSTTPLVAQATNVHSRQHRQNIYGEKTIQQQQQLRRIEAQQQKNEISKSLKMFAMLATYKNGNDYLMQRDPPVNDIMHDFHSNGYVTDDSNSFQPIDSLMGTSFYKPYNPNYNDYNKSGTYYDLNFNKNYGVSCQNYTNSAKDDSGNIAAMNHHYLNQNLWMLHSPTPARYFDSGITSSAHHQHAANIAAAAAATAAAAANIDYNNQSSKRPQKRFGSAKFDKYSAVKHCVFCENNNEPEAVVKSHAVRDSLGRVLCPKLRTYICPICKASGDKAHTVKYCPQKPIITMEDAVKAESLRLAKNSYFKQANLTRLVN